MEFISELLHFLKVRKKFWLLPIIIVMLVFGGLIVLAQGFGSRSVYLHALLRR